MLGSFKKLFFKDTGEDLATSIPEPVAIAPDAEWSTGSRQSAQAGVSSKNAQSAVFAANEMASPELLSLPLQVIFARLPNSLASVVQSQGNGFVSLSAKRIAQELPKGSVKITFGELRQAAPPGTFFDNPRHDQMLVELPLDEILMRLHRSLLTRRADQKQTQVSPEITNVFGPRGEGISLGAAPVSAPKQIVPKETAGDPFVSRRNDTTIMMRADTAIRTQNAAAAVAPAPNIHHSPTAVVLPPLRIVVSEPEAMEQNEPVIVPLTLLSNGWPEMIRVEIRELNLSNAPVALPLDKLGEALRAGKIVFTWKQICAWMRPPVESLSGAQEVQVELPLQIITPLFMSKHRPAKSQQKISLAEIPDLFAKKTASAISPDEAVVETVAQPILSVLAHVAPKTKPVALTMAPVEPVLVAPLVSQPELEVTPVNITPLPKPVEVEPVIAPEPEPTVANPNIIGEIFGQPARDNWAPTDVLRSLVTLPGIAGAFLAMQDGLLIAAELPAHFKAETVAAFLPQIFGRMNQYTKELKLGGLSTLTFVAENVSWQIVKSGVVYLVALSKPGENLPSEKLNTIAAELGKQMQ